MGWERLWWGLLPPSGIWEGNCPGARGSPPELLFWQCPCRHGCLAPPLRCLGCCPLPAPGAFVSLPRGSLEPAGTPSIATEREGRRLASREGPAALQLPWHCAAFTKPFSSYLDPTPGTARVITDGCG